MFKLRILFGGLCMFVPRKDDRELVALLVDARRIFEEPGREEIPSHQAVLRFDLSDVYDENPEDSPMPIPAGAKGLWFLDQVDVDIVEGQGRSNENANLNVMCMDPFAGGDEGEHHGEGHTEDKCFSFVAPVVDKSSRLATVRPEFLDKNLAAEFAQKLASRVHLRQGGIETSMLNADPDTGDFIVWRFRPADALSSANDRLQKLAAEVRLEADIDAPFVEFRSVNFDGSEGTSLKLAPPPSLLRLQEEEDGDGDGAEVQDVPVVQVSILNEEASKIVDALERQRKIETNNTHRPQDRLFEIFYRFVIDPPGDDSLPIPVADSMIKGADGAAGGSPPCSPARTGVS